MQVVSVKCTSGLGADGAVLGWKLGYPFTGEWLPQFLSWVSVISAKPRGATRLDVSGTQEVYVSKMGIPRVDDWCVCMVQ